MSRHTIDPFATHEPMAVEMVSRRDEHGTWAEPSPPLDPQWGHVDRLRWKTGCVQARTGVRVTICTWRDAPGYGIAYANTGVSAQPFVDAWHWLSAFEAGLSHAAEVPS